MKPIYIDNFISNPDDLFTELLNLAWLQQKQVRKEYFMSDIPRTYIYDKDEFEYNSNPFLSSVNNILTLLNNSIIVETGYNVCFLNRYDTQFDHLGWHSDTSPEVDPECGIAVISLGAEREIWWKSIEFKGEVPKENRQLLAHGSLFLMPPHFQQEYLHRIPKNSRPCGIRVSLTFRKYI